jgi:hypothetical protein
MMTGMTSEQLFTCAAADSTKDGQPAAPASAGDQGEAHGGASSRRIAIDGAVAA